MNSEGDITGVTVYGSSTKRVAPDSATISIGISRTEVKPKDAFASARLAAASVQQFLKESNFSNFGSSRITLAQENRYVLGESKFVGYKARVGYKIVLRDLDRTEELLTGLIAAGANELDSVAFETTRLKEIRAEARQEAVAAAREKAELYCKESGVALGKLLAIMDSNPDSVGGRTGHLTGGAAAGGAAPMEPAMITVGASVFLRFAIQ